MRDFNDRLAEALDSDRLEVTQDEYDRIRAVAVAHPDRPHNGGTLGAFPGVTLVILPDVAGDVQAVRSGRIGQRLARKATRRTVGRLLGRWGL